MGGGRWVGGVVCAHTSGRVGKGGQKLGKPKLNIRSNGETGGICGGERK